MDQKKAILCVDDEPMILFVLKKQLKGFFGNEFVYESAQSASEAMEVIAELEKEGVEIVLVISDWLMPGMKGDEFLAWVNQNHPKMKTVMISGQADPDAVERLQSECNLQAFILKPWTSNELIHTIKKCLEG